MFSSPLKSPLTQKPVTVGVDLLGAGGKPGLYFLTTGVRVKDPISDDLISCQSKIKLWHDEFVDGCFSDPSRFEKPIPRRKIQNFASAAIRSRIKTKDLKVMELQGTRDLFGRLLFLSTKEGIDLEHVFKYPLTPVPLSLCHLDGTVNKTDKAKSLWMPCSSCTLK